MNNINNSIWRKKVKPSIIYNNKPQNHKHKNNNNSRSRARRI